MHQDDQIIHLEGSSDDSGDYVEQNDHGKRKYSATTLWPLEKSSESSPTYSIAQS